MQAKHNVISWLVKQRSEYWTYCAADTNVVLCLLNMETGNWFGAITSLERHLMVQNNR